MNLVTVSQSAAPVLQTVFIVVIGLGYYHFIRVTQTMVQEMREEHTAGGGRPLITVSEDYANLPNMNIIVQNVGQGPVKDITFEFSAPVESAALVRRVRGPRGPGVRHTRVIPKPVDHLPEGT